MNAFKRSFHWVLVILWMAIIFYLSHQPAEGSAQLSDSMTRWLAPLVESIAPLKLHMDTLHFIVRKGAHFTAYFILGWLIIRALTIKNIVIRCPITLSIATLYAISDEFHQTFIAGRSGEIRDVLIDSIGALIGIMFYLIFHEILIKRKNAHSKS